MHANPHLILSCRGKKNSNLQCLEPLRVALFADGEAQKAAMKEARENLALVEQQLKDKEKRFLGGDDIGLADIAGGGLLAHWLGVLEEVAGVRVLGDEEHPALRRWAAEYCCSEAVKECLPDRGRLLSYFAGIRDKCVSVANSAQMNIDHTPASSI